MYDIATIYHSKEWLFYSHGKGIDMQILGNIVLWAIAIFFDTFGLYALIQYVKEDMQ